MSVPEEPPNPPVDRRTVLRLLGLARPYAPRLLLAAFCLLVSTGAFLALPYMFRLVTDQVFAHHDAAGLNRVILALLGLVVVWAVFAFGRGYLVAFVGARIVADLRVRLYRHLLSLSLSFYDERRSGDLMSRLSADTTLVQQVLSNSLLNILQQVVTLVGVVVIVLFLNWRLATVALLVTPVISLAAVMLGRRMRRLSKQSQAQLGDANVVLEETLSAMRVVKAFVREPYELERYRGAVEGSFGVGLSTARLQSAFGVIMVSASMAALAAVLWTGGHEVLAGRLTPGGLISFIFYMTFMIGPVENLASTYGELQQAAGGAARVFELLDLKPEIQDSPDACPLPPGPGGIDFEQVRFAYPAGRGEVLHGVSFSAPAGKRVALVGPSGAGKTTLVSLLARFYEPAAGVIRVDGYDVSGVTARSLRERIAVVPQEATLFGGSVRENIAYGDIAAGDGDIERAARLANAHAFILELPSGYDTVVGERGVKLSGGQRQRIAIARAILKNPRILLLDEATSSLDNESEALVQEALERLLAGRTTIVIAHRLTTVENADWIVVLDRGSIVEQGTHAVLLAREGLYHRLYTRSFDEEQVISA